ncbi:hypothetical protein BAS09_11740 [Elizabethkingia ursingii]|uniref:DUF4365 domain-containing protein n=1 Tax=Elizabethkingia ursingii TaxID=1756150 RepID=UPI0009CC82F5|nr:DUF4365 domain-containing protein [Elizabethkingia ursingii]OPC02375.1 hypothetical protein BAS09_11740 [Elizabethkingia ursingii]
MNHFKIERKAIYDTAKFFNECGWFFREQPICDIGVDAIVETPIDENGKINIFALQIKGGESNFQKKKNYLTFYFSDKHFHYWNAISENYPLFIILQDSKSETIYWQYYNQSFISKTPKNWKIDIPEHNIIDISSKQKILNILHNHRHSNNSTLPFYNLSIKLKKEDAFFIRFTINENNNRLNLNILYKRNFTTLDLFYRPRRQEWDKEKSFLIWENQYYYTLLNFENYIRSEFAKTKKNKISFIKLMNSLNMIIDGNIENLQEFLFNLKNKDNQIPKYKDFINAFEEYSKLNRKQYEAQSLDSIIIFKTKENCYELSCYESLTQHLKSYIENYSYSEIYTETNEHIWSEIYLDTGIEKSKFIPVMQNELERYWHVLYKRIREEIGRTEHLDESKEQSWRMFKTFSDLYNDTVNIIELAYDFDDMVLYPIAVISMMKIFNPEVCYTEYCELELDASGEWESICLDNNNQESPIFHIKPSEF